MVPKVHVVWGLKLSPPFSPEVRERDDEFVESDVGVILTKTTSDDCTPTTLQ